jgi:hypothetical protein
MNYAFLNNMGRLGATVAGTDPCSTGGHPKTSTERKRRLQMNKFRFTINALAIVIFTLAFASISQAQATRTWVSGVGDDANPCSRTAPCKTFAGAISKTANGGEIDCIDSGGFGAVTITKGITIDGTGVLAGILNSLTNGVIVNATSTDIITLRGLSINGDGSGGINGIRFLAGKALNVINCVIQRGSGNGIDVALNTVNETQVSITDCVIKKFTGDGISIANAQGGAVRFTIERTQSLENGNGLHVKGANSQGTARNCVFSLNATNGVFADAVSGFAIVRVWNSQISGNLGNGVRAGIGGNAGTPVVQIAQNQIDTNVGFGALITAPGIIETFTNNSIKGNGTNLCNGGAGSTSSGPGN